MGADLYQECSCQQSCHCECWMWTGQSIAGPLSLFLPSSSLQPNHHHLLLHTVDRLYIGHTSPVTANRDNGRRRKADPGCDGYYGNEVPIGIGPVGGEVTYTSLELHVLCTCIYTVHVYVHVYLHVYTLYMYMYMYIHFTCICTCICTCIYTVHVYVQYVHVYTV